MEEFSSFRLTRAQEADYVNVHNRDFFQIQGDIGTAVSQLIHNLAQMLRLRASDQANSTAVQDFRGLIFPY